MKSNYYYDLADDLKKYPDAWAYLIWSGRNTGKTYSTLKYCLDRNLKFVFIKRTKEDVALLTSGSGKVGSKRSEYGADMSPFKAINRDTGSNIHAFDIYKNYIGGFWRCDDEGAAVGAPIGYIVALSTAAKVKGFDLSDCDVMIFDEFIPNAWEITKRGEGKQILDLYMTIARDREHRGKDPLKLIALANPTALRCGLFEVLEVTDTVARMSQTGEEYHEQKGILLHQIQMGANFQRQEENMDILQTMAGTDWADMSLGSGFAYNDMSMIRSVPLKGYVCVYEVRYKKNVWYIYQKDGDYYVCTSRGKARAVYDLNTDIGVRAFYREVQMDLKDDYINGCVVFQTYTMYDVLINFRKYFDI